MFIDSSTATDSYSIVGRRVEIAGIPFIGLGDITGGGVTKEGQTYVRGTDGRILFISDGLKTPQDKTTVTTMGTFKTLKATLEAQAIAQGLVGEERWMDAPVSFTNQIASNNPLAEPFTETMTLSVMSWVEETPGGGDGSKVTVVWKQHSLPTV